MDHAVHQDAVSPHPDGAIVRVRVQPRATGNAIEGEANGRLRMRLNAPPVEGAANRAVIALLAKRLGAAPSSIRLLRGRTAREKDLLIAGYPAERVAARLRDPAK